MEGIPAYHRPVNTVFQDYALFPHLTVEQNIMFGLQMEGVDKKEARKRAAGGAGAMVRLPGVGEAQAASALRRSAAAGGIGARLGQAAGGAAAG